MAVISDVEILTPPERAVFVLHEIFRYPKTHPPNVNEHFETLLPLVPGVVRGPDERINLKGASNNQSGALLNSAGGAHRRPGT
ncbi:MAG: hypothetical protein WBW03_23030, partial [Silvibacterium sp.]